MKKSKIINIRGFTIIELMVSLTVLTLISLFAGRIYLGYTATSKDLQAANLVYEESRFLMEKIVREIRQNSIDFEQYWNQNVMIPLNGAGGYADNYCEYSDFFYDDENNSIGSANALKEADILNAGLPDANAINSIEKELYLINIAGNRRTMLTRVEKEAGGNIIGKAAMLKLTGQDFGADHIDGRDSYNSLKLHDPNCKLDDRENDGRIDSWHCAPGYPCKVDQTTASSSDPACEGYTHLIVNDPENPNHSFVDISPNAINVLDLKFMISPKDDPWKAYNINEVQIQPHVTIQLTTEANPALVPRGSGRIPSITLTSTITTRNYDEIKSDCR